MPQEDDEVISLTETWADSAANEGVSKSTKKHSRKPRTGRRAKARARLEEFYCQRACVANSVVNESSNLAPLGFLTALIEGMEEDSLEDHAQLLARGGSHVDSVPKDTDENSVSSCGQSEEASDADLVVPQNAANSIQPFEVRLFKRTGASLGVAFNIVRDGLLVSWVGDEGLAGIWNGICDVEMQLRNGDKVIGSNGSSDPKLMLESFSRLGAHRLQVLRGPFDPELPETQMPPAYQAGGLTSQQGALEHGPTREQREESERARQAEASIKEETKEAEARQLLHAGPGDLQKMLAERLARSQRR